MRSTLDPFIENLAQAIGEEGVDGKLAYVISRLVASSYAPWDRSSIQRARGLYALLADEFYTQVAQPFLEEDIERYGNVPEYQDADEESVYRHASRYLVERFPSTGTFKRHEFDKLISNSPLLDGQPSEFTDRLHKDGYIVMGKDTVTLGLLGLELRNAEH